MHAVVSCRLACKMYVCYFSHQTSATHVKKRLNLQPKITKCFSHPDCIDLIESILAIEFH